MSIAATPTPPYFAAIFTAVQREGFDAAAYEAMGGRMVELASQQPGFLGFEYGSSPPDRVELFISYWRSAEDIRAWKQVADHLEAQRLGRESWLEHYCIRIAKVERAYTETRV